MQLKHLFTFAAPILCMAAIVSALDHFNPNYHRTKSLQAAITVAIAYNEVRRCSGALIGPNLVLTSARCVERYAGALDRVKVRAGVGEPPPHRYMRGRTSTVSQVIPHPSRHIDVAILLLRYPIREGEPQGRYPYGSLMGRIRHAGLAEGGYDPPMNRPVSVVKWEATSPPQIQSVGLPRVACSGQLGATMAYNGVFCTQDSYGRMGICLGDAGGPVVNEYLEIIGISADTGVSCRGPFTQPNVHTSIGPIEEWIEHIVELHQPPVHDTEE